MFSRKNDRRHYMPFPRRSSNFITATIANYYYIITYPHFGRSNKGRVIRRGIAPLVSLTGAALPARATEEAPASGRRRQAPPPAPERGVRQRSETYNRQNGRNTMSKWMIFLCTAAIALGVCSVASAQTTFGEQQVIMQPEADSPTDVYAADLDGDGDLDVLSASEDDDKIAWYENDGSGNFGDQQVITTSAAGAESVYAADLDGDGDLDVLSASYRDNKIAWYENDGSGTFGAQQVITTSAERGGLRSRRRPRRGRGFTTSSRRRTTTKIAWYENDGSGNFGAATNDYHKRRRGLVRLRRRPRRGRGFRRPLGVLGRR